MCVLNSITWIGTFTKPSSSFLGDGFLSISFSENDRHPVNAHIRDPGLIAHTKTVNGLEHIIDVISAEVALS